MGVARELLIRGVLLLCFLIAIVIYFRMPAAEKKLTTDHELDFDKEGIVLARRLLAAGEISDPSSLIGFSPKIFCINRGGDIRKTYERAFGQGPLINQPRPHVSFEGYTYLLLADASNFYLEKFDNTEVIFFDFPRDHCGRIKDGLEISLAPPPQGRSSTRFAGKLSLREASNE